MASIAHVHEAHARRQRRIRARVIGTSDRPRLNVFRSLDHIYAQVIDDSVGHTLASASTLEKEVEAQCKDMTKSQAAQVVGRIVAQRALASGVTRVVFDRGGRQYHGRIKALAEAAREAGLDF